MSQSNNDQSKNLGTRAERVMAAFLKAAHDVAGVRSMLRAGDAWLQAFESLECPDPNHDLFLRHVSTVAIAQLLSDSRAAGHEENAGAVGRTTRFTAMRSAA
jgi:hypothetical protein